MMKKLLLILMTFVMTLPVALADSVFSNPLFDTVLILLFSAAIFLVARELINKMK